MYTQYVDIQSSTLSQWTKIQSRTTGPIGTVIVRAYVGGSERGVQFQKFDGRVSLAWKASSPIGAIDIALYDSNGDPLYAPFDGTKLEWQLSCSLEL
jgi:hypothetical protein